VIRRAVAIAAAFFGFWSPVAAAQASGHPPRSAVAAPASADVIVSGPARFEVLTPSLIRMEYAQDRQFENAPTLTAVRAPLAPLAISVSTRDGWLAITTRALTLRYRLGSGPFSAANVQLTMTIGGRLATAHPVAGSSAGNLGGWTRALDNEAGPVPLHDGVLSTAGWYVLDDTQTALLTAGSPGYQVRPAHTGPYQDWYLFAYGHAFQQGLSDLRTLTGPAPLLPRSAFGVWFSRYYPYSASGYKTLLAQFRSGDVPLDTLSVDTDYKREANAAGAAIAATVVGAPGLPYAWNGWEWDPTLFPDPQGFVDWAHSEGLSLALNIHPSIDTTDPRYAGTVAQSGPLYNDDSDCRVLQADPLGGCMTFDWENPSQLAAYFALQQPFAQQGVDLFWLDWCCEGPQPAVAGLTPDTWINSRYASEQRARGSRWPVFSRIGAQFEPGSADGPDGDRGEGDSGDGAFAEHRYTIQFTGDTCATWPMLGFEAQLSAEEGNIGLPYVSDDIGSFNGVPGNLPCGSADETSAIQQSSRHLPDDLYARWVQLGTFQPLDRLHSNHGDRLPWQYGAAADASAASSLRLREALDPYTYTLARRAYDTGQPITGALYLQWPGVAGAYDHPSEYTYGPDLVVAPVTADGDPAPATVWVPPGAWVDMFTGERFQGPSVHTLAVPLSQMPVLVRAGSVLVTQPYAPYTPPGPNPNLILTAYPGARGAFTLYDDQGTGFGYQRGEDSFTQIGQRRHGRRAVVTIGAAKGSFPGRLARRSWQVVFEQVPAPRRVTLMVGRRTVRLSQSRWRYVAATRTLTVGTGAVSTSKRVVVTAS
jgi:alpha-glucosidase (family GH31 glycosyl hydrolase)